MTVLRQCLRIGVGQAKTTSIPPQRRAKPSMQREVSEHLPRGPRYLPGSCRAGPCRCQRFMRQLSQLAKAVSQMREAARGGAWRDAVTAGQAALKLDPSSPYRVEVYGSGCRAYSQLLSPVHRDQVWEGAWRGGGDLDVVRPLELCGLAIQVACPPGTFTPLMLPRWLPRRRFERSTTLLD